MYHGKMTDELKKLYSEYEKKFGHDPGGYEELDYGQKHYRQYGRDINCLLYTSTGCMCNWRTWRRYPVRLRSPGTISRT